VNGEMVPLAPVLALTTPASTDLPVSLPTCMHASVNPTNAYT
jgi:hypothetical protein